MDDLSIGPVLTWTTDAMLGHMEKLLQLPGEPLGLLSDVRTKVCTREDGSPPASCQLNLQPASSQST